MKRTYLYPSLLLSLPIGIIVPICLCGALATLDKPVVSIIIASACLLTLCIAFYTCPIVSFDEQQIYISRLFPGTTRCIRWEEIRSISPLENGGIIGLACLIRADKKEYTLTIFLKGWYKLLRHWDSIHPAAATVPLKRDLLPYSTYRKPFWRTSGLIIALFLLFFWLYSYPIVTNNGLHPARFIWCFVAFLLFFLLFGGCYLNYYEFTPTHFCIRSPFPFWNYKVRWEDIHSIRQCSTKADFICICTRQYRYRYIMMGYLLPKETLARLQTAGVTIE